VKLLKAHFSNFRLLRDLTVDFSVSEQKPLTVVRAANESGKTTMLNALQWGLYGDVALPSGGADMRLHPIDWDIEADGSRVPIMVTIEFEVTSVRRSPTGFKETRKRYRLIRSTTEEIDGDGFTRAQPSVRLLVITDTGDTPLTQPEAIIADELPIELRDVFFTDGDRALSFIEADVALTTKRDRVQRAIRSLLGLGVIKDAMRHVEKAAVEINKSAKKLGGSDELGTIANRLDEIEVDRERLAAELVDARSSHANLDGQIAEIDRRIAAALAKGDREKLGQDIESTRKEIGKIDVQLDAAVKEHAALFRGIDVARGVLGATLAPAYAKLDTLYDRKEIPSATIPVLEDRLDIGSCICGESLSEVDEDGAARRARVNELIEKSRRADDIQKMVTALYFGAKALQSPADGEARAFGEAFTAVVEKRDGLQDLRDENGRKLRALELQLDEMPDTDVANLRKARREFENQKDRVKYREGQIDTQLSGLVAERTGLVERRDALLREQSKGARIIAELDVAKDITGVLRRAFDRITDEELIKVSDLTNEIFLGMIGADPDQGALIRRAEVSKEFDILVYGPSDRKLDPDRDLNGASRRALTLAFILALTKVSEVEAPNVIDTPLGMMSGFVKRSVLRKASTLSAQLILFLTHSEIEGCEAILDEMAGEVVTLTNPAHYPRMLVNDPRSPTRQVLRCDCDHRSHCELCERVDDETPVLVA
jgi:DNA sulfur modification protein DndD